MSQVEIPFLPRFEALVREGHKTCTSRTKSYGRPGDYFEAWGRLYVLTKVERATLQRVSTELLSAEGFTSRENFVVLWNQLHPRKKYSPNIVVNVHHFESMKRATHFHTHEFDSQGRCKICGHHVGHRVDQVFEQYIGERPGLYGHREQEGGDVTSEHSS